MSRTKRERPLRDAISNVSRTVSSSTTVIVKSFEYLNIQLDGLLSEAKLDLLVDSIENLEDASVVLGWTKAELSTAKAELISKFKL